MFKVFKILCLVVMLVCYPFVFNSLCAQSDGDFRKSVIGSWVETVGGMEGVSTFFEDGRYECRAWDSVSKKPIIELAEGTWWIEDGKLYNKIQSVSPSTFQFPKDLAIDKIVDITNEVMTLIDEYGNQYTKTKVK